MEASEFVDSGKYLDPLMVHHITRDDDVSATAREFFYDNHPVFGRGAINNQKYNMGGNLTINVPKELHGNTDGIRNYLGGLINGKKQRDNSGVHSSKE